MTFKKYIVSLFIVLIFLFFVFFYDNILKEGYIHIIVDSDGKFIKSMTNNSNSYSNNNYSNNNSYSKRSDFAEEKTRNKRLNSNVKNKIDNMKSSFSKDNINNSFSDFSSKFTGKKLE